ncbi:MAG: ABC transporter substrate-binding protein [Deltaproteobacteria bacterium]|jgi:ABC-type branched-subunit amino acid transport system substrate-binding protein|nr:ABC transporter substrate-binding protein [Deltaproteobacteria bacterium]
MSKIVFCALIALALALSGLAIAQGPVITNNQTLSLEASELPLYPEADPSPMAVLFVSPQTGAFASLGRGAVKGARLAHKRWGGALEFLEVKEEDFPVLEQVANPDRVKIVAGHLFEESLLDNISYYEKRDLPVILPFLDNWETNALGPNYYQLLVSVPAQGRALALDVLASHRNAPAVYILEGDDPSLKLLADSFVETLANPNQEEKTNYKALPKKTVVQRVVIQTPEQDLPEFLATIKKNQKYVVLLALTTRQALGVAPYFLESNFKSSFFYGPMALANRDVGAAYLSLGFNLNLCVPANMADTKNEELSVFIDRYRQEYKEDPVWSSVVAYDAVSLAELALSSEDGFAFLNSSEGHAGLVGTYLFSSSTRPSGILRVDLTNTKNVSYLP